MDRRDFRSTLPFSSVSGSERRTRTSSMMAGLGSQLGGGLASRLTRRVGQALGLGDAQAKLDKLEERQLLAGTSFDTATALAANDATGRLFFADSIVSALEEDYYSVTIPANTFFGVLADTSNQNPVSNLDTRVRLFNAARQLVATGNDNGNLTTGVARDGWIGFANNTGSAQQFFIVVDGQGGTTGTYTLRVRGSNVGFDAGGENPINLGIGRELGSPPPNFAVNPPVLPVPILGQLGGTADPVTDRLRQDEIIYRFATPDNAAWTSLVTISAQSPANAANQSRRLDTRVEVYSATGQLITADSETGRLTDAFATFVAQRGQVYFIRVRSDEIRTANIELATGPFFLMFDGIAEDMADPQQVGDPMDAITRRALDTAALFGAFDEPTVAPTPDLDGNAASDAPAFLTASYSFIAQGTGLAIITAIPTGLNPLRDPALSLYDANGVRIGFSDNLIGLNAQLRVQLVGGQRYYLVVDAFNIPNGTQYIVSVEANHTYEAGVPDDHPNRPDVVDAGGSEEQRVSAARDLRLAQPLPWSQPFMTLDEDRNPLRDRGLRVSSSADGRIHEAGDTDVFQFTPPVDMLNQYNGNNDDAGSSLFVGGRFDLADPTSNFPVTSRNLATWDAADWFATGRQFDDTVNGVNITYGFRDNPATAGTAVPNIFAMTDWRPFLGTVPQARRLVVGGDFELVVPTGNPLDPLRVFRNLAIWEFRGGRWQWNLNSVPVLPGTIDAPTGTPIRGANGPVFALQEFEGDQTLPGAVPSSLYIGGDFTAIGATATNRLARFRLDTGVAVVPGAVTLDGSVRAFAVYNAPDPGTGRTAQPPTLAEVLDPADIPLSLYIGGEFTEGVAGWTGAGGGLFRLFSASARTQAPPGGPLPGLPGTGVNGPVYALSTYTYDPDGAGPRTAVTSLAIGGLFTEAGAFPVGGGFGGNPTITVPAENFALWGEVDVTQTDVQAPNYAPQLIWRAPINLPGGAVRAMTVWQRAAINLEDPALIPSTLVIGGEFTNFLSGWEGVDGVFAAVPGNQNAAGDPGVASVNGPVFALATSRAFASGADGTTLQTEAQEPSIRLAGLDSGFANQQALYVGGTFTQAGRTTPLRTSTPGVFQISADTGPLGLDDFFAVRGLASGVAREAAGAPVAGVFALQQFDDADPNRWDRHDRAATRLSIAVTPTVDAFLDVRVRVYNSNLQLVWDFSQAGSESINPAGPLPTDPAGMVDTSVTLRDPASLALDNFRGITVWGGETYYIEVSDGNRGGTGRYTLTITTDAGPRSVRLDTPNQRATPGQLIFDDPGFVRDVNTSGRTIEEGFEGGQLFGEPAGGVLNMFPNTLGKRAGDDDIMAQDAGSSTDTGGTSPNGNSIRSMRIRPSTGQSIIKGGDLGVISFLEDVDVYTFRATYSGTAEVRVQTQRLFDQYGEVAVTFPNTAGPARVGFTALPVASAPSSGTDIARRNSRLDASVRILRNDLEQVAWNDNSAAIRPDFGRAQDRRFVGSTGSPVGFGAGGEATNMPSYRFEGTDSRVVFPIVQNQVYFILIESGQRYRDGKASRFADRVLNDPSDIDWRFALGSYSMVVNQMPDFQNLVGYSESVNGNIITDDHYDTLRVRGIDQDGLGNGFTPTLPIGAYSTPLAIDEDADSANNGRGSITGVIRGGVIKPVDIDSFRLILPTSGTFSITVTPTSAPALVPTLNVSRNGIDVTADPVLVGAGVRGTDGVTRFTFANGVQGTEYFLEVGGADGTQGAYRIDVQTQPVTDDFANIYRWADAQTITIRDFQGVGSVTGIIERATDTDLFRFELPTWDRVTVTLTPLDTSLAGTITIFEETDNSQSQFVPIYRRIGEGVTQTNGTVVARASVTPNRVGTNPTREYRFYYIGVDGLNTAGRYQLTIAATPTDDHPDADTDANNAFDTGEFAFATPVVLDSVSGVGAQNGNIEVVGDSDLFTFTVPATGLVTVTITRPTDSTIRPRLSLLNNDASIISQETAADSVTFTLLTTSATFQRNRVLFVAVDALEVTGTNPSVGRTGRYVLTVSAPPIDDYPNATEWSIAAPLAISTGSGRSELGVGTPAASNPRISYVGDSDLFTFRPILAGSHTISITPIVSALGTIAPRIEVFISTNLVTPIATNNASAAGATASVTLAGLLTTQDYFILVTAQSGVTGADGRGEYRLVLAGPIPTNPQPQNPGEVDPFNPTVIVLNDRTGAGSLARTTNPQQPEINPADDRDLYAFTPSANGRVFVRLARPQGSVLAATFSVFTRLSDGTLVPVPGVSVGERPGAIAYTEFAGTGGTQYFVLVDGLGPSVGAYGLEVGTAPAVNRLVIPEGFSGDRVFEYIPVVNPNNFPLFYTTTLYFENDQVVNGNSVGSVSATRRINANSRDSVTVWAPTGNAARPFASDIVDSSGNILVPRNVAYSIVVEWTVPSTNLDTGAPISALAIQPLGATLSHYDFGSSVGEALTQRQAAEWTFPRVELASGSALNFVLFWNPNPFEVTVEIVAYLPDGTSRVLPETRTVGANRRSGFAVFELASLAGVSGVFSAQLRSRAANPVNDGAFQGIVSSLTAYRVGQNSESATLVMGDADGGSTRGAFTRFLAFAQGSGQSSDVTFFNPSSQPATVTLEGRYINPDIPSIARTFQVPGGRTVTFTGLDLGLRTGQAAGLSFASNVPVSVQSTMQQRGDADASTPTYSAGTRFYFGDAYINIDRAGVQYFETLSFYNPTSQATNVAVTLIFFNRPAGQSTAVINVPVSAGGFAQVNLHERPEVLNNRGPGNSPDAFFGIRAEGNVPFMMAMEHYDLFLGGGWAAQGVPFGISTPLNQLS